MKSGMKAGMSSGRALVLVAVACAAFAMACSDGTEPASRAGVNEPASTDPQAGMDELIERSRQASENRPRDLLAGVELTLDQKRRLQEQRDARASWRAEHAEELNALMQQSAAARQAGDDAAFEAARDALQQLRDTAPNARDVFAEVTAEQRAQIEQNKDLGNSSRRFDDESGSRSAAVNSSSSKNTRPLVGTSRPPRMLSNVDLPLPDGPSRTRNSPARRMKSTPRSAWTSTSPMR